MSLFSSISWADFITTAIALLLLFNIAVFVYYRFFYKGSKETENTKQNKFTSMSDEDTNLSSDDDEQDVMYVSMYDDEIMDNNELSATSQEDISDGVGAMDNDSVNSVKEENDVDDSSSEEEFLAGIDQNMFFDGMPVDDADLDDVEMAFQNLGYDSDELDESSELYYDENLISASISSINVDASELDEEDELFLDISRQLEEIHEKEQEENLVHLQTNEEKEIVNDNFFGDSDL